MKCLPAYQFVARFSKASDGSRHYPFGKGHSHITKIGLDDSHIFHVPISSRINDSNDKGTPISLARPEEASGELSVFANIGRIVAKDLFLLQDQAKHNSCNLSVLFKDKPNVVFDMHSIHLQVDHSDKAFVARFYSDEGAYEIRLSGDVLYSMTENVSSLSSSGDSLIAQENLTHAAFDKPKLFPCNVDRKDDGFVVHWANGAHLFYSKHLIAKAAGAIFNQN